MSEGVSEIISIFIMEAISYDILQLIYETIKNSKLIFPKI